MSPFFSAQANPAGEAVAPASESMSYELMLSSLKTDSVDWQLLDALSLSDAAAEEAATDSAMASDSD